MKGEYVRGDGSKRPDRCDICGRKWNARASDAMRRWYPDALVCEHDGPCSDHPEGERCQYLYALVTGVKPGTRYYKCGLRLA